MSIRTQSVISALCALALLAAVGPAVAEDTPPAPPALQPNGVVALLTDYGADSLYVGMLRGAIAAKRIDVRTVDLTHSVPAYDILTGAFMLAEGCSAFPEGTVFCAVVDPGVGTDRRVLVLRTRRNQVFVAPDNGLLTVVAERDGVAEAREGVNRDLWSDAESHTFHGRDIFGPLAAALAAGAPVASAGPDLPDFIRFEVPQARIRDGAIEGVVLRSDPYGNLVTNIPATLLAEADIAPDARLRVTLGEETFEVPFKTTYSDVPAGERLALVQSAGFLELAVNLGSLAAETRADAKTPVTLSPIRP